MNLAKTIFKLIHFKTCIKLQYCSIKTIVETVERFFRYPRRCSKSAQVSSSTPSGSHWNINSDVYVVLKKIKGDFKNKNQTNRVSAVHFGGKREIEETEERVPVVERATRLQ